MPLKDSERDPMEPCEKFMLPSNTRQVTEKHIPVLQREVQLKVWTALRGAYPGSLAMGILRTDLEIVKDLHNPRGEYAYYPGHNAPLFTVSGPRLRIRNGTAAQVREWAAKSRDDILKDLAELEFEVDSNHPLVFLEWVPDQAILPVKVFLALKGALVEGTVWIDVGGHVRPGSRASKRLGWDSLQAAASRTP